MTDAIQAPVPQDRVLIFDTTLRDGEQSPGATMTLEEKLQIATLLDEMGVDIIEAGFPIASDGDFEAVTAIARQAQNAVICGLARANFKDIDRCWEAVRHARRPRIHTFIGTSPLHRAIPNLDMDQMAERIHDTVTHARNLCDNVQWSPMDATRTEHDYLCRTVLFFNETATTEIYTSRPRRFASPPPRSTMASPAPISLPPRRCSMACVTCWLNAGRKMRRWCSRCVPGCGPRVNCARA